MDNWGIYNYVKAKKGGGSGDNSTLDALIDRSLTSINNNRVTSIGSSAFYNCAYLTTAVFSSALTIGGNAFQGCSNLTEVNFPNVTSIGGNAFQGCSNLTEVNFPNVTSIGGNAFQGCSNLTEVNFPNVTSIGGNAFNNCRSLTTADFISITMIQPRAFVGCTNLTTLVLRIEQVCALSNTDALSETVISRGTGYIYVPDDLVESYKTATNWTVYAEQIKGLSQLPEGV